MPNPDGVRLPPPPRSVPLTLFVVNAAGSKIAWLVLGFASIFFWGFCAQADLSFLTFRPPFEETSGTVVTVKATGARENRQTIQKVEYTYVAAGQLREGTSYAKGSAPNAGERVTVEYLPGAPERSRIAGMRRAFWSPWMLLLGLFPGITLLVVLFTIRFGLKRHALLRDGILTTAKFVEERPTNMRINNRQVMELLFSFTAHDGREFTASASTHLAGQLRDDGEEPLLYDPVDPSRSILLDLVSSRPEVDESGELRGRPLAALVSFLIPALVIGANALMLFFRIGS
jgi:hypothetical protein